MGETLTVTPDALPKLASLSSNGMLIAQEPGGPLATATLAQLASLIVGSTDWASVPTPVLTGMFNAMHAAGLFDAFLGT